jgi:hypothetical protein
MTVHGLTVVNGKRAGLIIRIVLQECKRIVKGGLPRTGRLLLWDQNGRMAGIKKEEPS